MTVPQGDTVATGVQGPLVPITKAILSVSSLLFLLLITPTSAQQPAAPLPAILFSSIASTNNTLYIRGGNIQAQQVAQQFYSLNLTPLLNYSGNNITWTKRNAGPLIDFRTVLPLAVDNDNQELISFGDLGTLARYTVVTNTWSKEVPICKTPFNANTASLSIANFQPALTDPRTGLIYIPYGYDMGKSMLVFNTVSNACSGIPMPIGSNGQLYAWSESRNAIYMLGNTAPPARIALWQFDLAIREWNIFKVDPQFQLDECMASAYGGQKLIIFGGTTAEGIRHGNTFIFDTVANTWTKGATSPNPRSDMACATAGDFLVAWGGYENSVGEVYPTEILFYNIKNDKWVNRTDIAPPPPITTTLSTPTVPAGSGFDSGQSQPGTDTASSTSKNNAALLGGGVTAGVALIAVIAGFVLFRRRRKNLKPRRDPQDLKLNSLSFPDSSQASLASKGQLDTHRVANAPHATVDPATTHFPNYKTTVQESSSQVQDSDITVENQAGDGYSWTQGYHGQSLRIGQGRGRGAIIYPIPPPTPLSPQLYHTPPQHIDQDGSEYNQHQTWNNPQHCESLPLPLSPLRSPDYEMLQLEFPSPVCSTLRNPQGQQMVVPTNNPLEEIAAVHARYEQHVESLRQEQQAEMERIRREWEEQLSERRKRIEDEY
ncbi:MAG: hypothetical protein JOS17DRAFT_813874 [Linnemannia elongata]|nr:MAG: hypothetical protein JOS17DRAFT_813874 [Linnemannia elongata]